MAGEEAPLVARARAGDLQAFEQLAERHGALVRSLAALYVGAGDSADAAQEIWIAVYRKIRQLEDGASFVAWLRTVIRHSCIDYCKAKARRSRGEVQLSPTEWLHLAEWVVSGGDQDVAEALERAELRRHVAAALDGLPAGLGRVLRLRLLRGLSYAEIAATAHLPLATVKWRLHVGKQVLRARLTAVLQKGRPWR